MAARAVRFSSTAALVLLLGAPSVPRAGAVVDGDAAAAWERVLGRAARGGGLAYAEIARDPADLGSFLAALGDARPEGAPRAEQLAFWINAYNAVVAHFVLERYPGIRSVREVEGFFDELTFPVAGEGLTLDEIEGRARALGDPRVHFAVVCASASCPDLRAEPYRAADLDRQLEEQTRAFLADADKGLAFDPAGGDLWLSSIFKWYAGDFTGGSTIVAYFARGRLLEWILPHLPSELRLRIEGADPSVRYLEYDWALNDRSAPPAGDGG